VTLTQLADTLGQDIRYALRAQWKSPGFTGVAILSLALGIGANTTIFTFVNAVLLRPLPYPGSDRLVVLREQPLGSGGTVNVHPLNFVEWQRRSRSFESLALVLPPPLNVIGDNGVEQIARVQMTPDLFRVFGVSPLIGRAFTSDEARQANTAVILGYGFWQRWFGGDPNVVGRTLQSRDGALTIVGVAPAGLRIGIFEPDVYTPLPIDPADPGSVGSRSFQCYGRLKPDVTLEAARAEMAGVASLLAREYRLDEGMGVFVARLHDYLVTTARPALRLLMAVVATVLIIACVNLAGLLMARGVGRRGELAIRASLGAGRGRLVRQLIVESLVLSLLGGAAGLAVAYWGVRVLSALAAGALTADAVPSVRLDATCLIFTLIVSTLTALVFGLMPAWQDSRVDPQRALGDQSRGGTLDRRHHAVRSVLVVAEVALAVTLLVGAGLLTRTFSRLMHVDLGFQPSSVVTMGLFLGLRDPASRIESIDRILDRVEQVPGVEAAGTIQFLPMSGMACGTGFWMEGTPADPSRALPTECSLISRGYFAAMSIPIIEGRAFDRRDRMGSPRVVMINRAFARRYFPDRSAVGRRILVQASNQALAEIIGITGDVRHNGLTTEPTPTVFLLHAQTPGYITTLVVRTAGDLSAQAAAIRRAIHEVDPMQGVSGVKAMQQYVGDSLSRPRLYTALMAAFAQLALLLAAVGVYGVLAYVVSQRTREIGIRVALGARSGQVFRSVFTQGAALTGAGLVAGVAIALALKGFLSAFLFGVTATDPLTYVAAVVGFSMITLAAAAVPAYRASRVDPNAALRM
jgi:putative ABC transport system permease protein